MKKLSNQAQLSRVVIKGYKSIRECDLSLSSLNVLVGCNGAGKSNLITFFKMIQHIFDGKLQFFIGKQGGPDALLHFGRKQTKHLIAQLYFGNNGYLCSLEPTVDNRLMFREESCWWHKSTPRQLGSGHFESKIKEGSDTGIDSYVLSALRQWRVYHFHDTSDTALVKGQGLVNDNLYLRSDASNLAAYLYLLNKKYPQSYQHIIKTIQMVAPFFGDFNLRVLPENNDLIELEWVEKGGDTPFKAHYLSDGTLRFICLATVLLQPEELQPQTLIVDEPELGLHPYAIELMASMMKSMSKKRQLILATQSVEFLNCFDPEDVLVVDRDEKGSSFRRLQEQELSSWLDEYSLGDLWKKNVFGGRPK